MNAMLNDMEVRVLGCLIEKELTTPEYYPLSLNALTNACNQKSNRDPVLNLEEVEVVRALDSLKFKQLALLSAEGGRVPKYRHTLIEKLRLDPPELAVLAELLLRGPQTVGELRARADRLHAFNELALVEDSLGEMMERAPRLPGSGQGVRCRALGGTHLRGYFLRYTPSCRCAANFLRVCFRQGFPGAQPRP